MILAFVVGANAGLTVSIPKEQLVNSIGESDVTLKVNIGDVKTLDFILWKLGDIIMKQGV